MLNAPRSFLDRTSPVTGYIVLFLNSGDYFILHTGSQEKINGSLTELNEAKQLQEGDHPWVAFSLRALYKLWHSASHYFMDEPDNLRVEDSASAKFTVHLIARQVACCPVLRKILFNPYEKNRLR